MILLRLFCNKKVDLIFFFADEKRLIDHFVCDSLKKRLKVKFLSEPIFT